MALPVQNGFAGNVNVQMQPYTLTMSDYVALSRKQFKQIGLSLLSVQEEGDVAFLEYEGALQGRDLHWYAKAIKSGDYIYLVTATDSQKNWPKSRQKLISVVNSFKLK